MAEFWLFT